MEESEILLPTEESLESPHIQRINSDQHMEEKFDKFAFIPISGSLNNDEEEFSNDSLVNTSHTNKNSKKMRREVSWTDLNGLPLEEVYEIPGAEEAELRKSHKRVRVAKTNFAFNICCGVTIYAIVLLVIIFTSILSYLFS